MSTVIEGVERLDGVWRSVSSAPASSPRHATTDVRRPLRPGRMVPDYSDTWLRIVERFALIATDLGAEEVWVRSPKDRRVVVVADLDLEARLALRQGFFDVGEPFGADVVPDLHVYPSRDKIPGPLAGGQRYL